jgi:hypothetical protein
MPEYGPSGVLFYNKPEDKKHDRMPDFGGSVELDRELLDALYRKLERSGDRLVKLDLGGWRKVSKAGKNFISLRPSVYDEDRRGSGDRSSRGGRDEDRGRDDRRYRDEDRSGSSRGRGSSDDLDDEIPF